MVALFELMGASDSLQWHFYHLIFLSFFTFLGLGDVEEDGFTEKELNRLGIDLEPNAVLLYRENQSVPVNVRLVMT